MNEKEIENLAEKMHEWYLEATQKLNPESFNKNAQKKYSELTDEQRFIDIYIAEKVLEKEKKFVEALKSEINIKLGEDKNNSNYEEYWGDSTNDFFDLIDKLAEEYFNSPQDDPSGMLEDDEGGFQKKKKIKIKVTKKIQKEINEVRRKCGFEEEPIKPEYELEALLK